MEMTNKKIEAIQKLTGLEYETNINYNPQNIKFISIGLEILSIDIVNKRIEYGSYMGFTLPIPFEWLKPLAEILEGNN